MVTAFTASQVGKFLVGATISYISYFILRPLSASVPPSPTDPGFITHPHTMCSTKTATCTNLSCSLVASGQVTLSTSGSVTVTGNVGQFGKLHSL